MDQGATTTARTTQVNNAISAGAIAVILGTTTISSAGIPAAPPNAVTLSAPVNVR